MFSKDIYINISLPKIKGPPKLGYPSDVHEMKILNPSIVLAPKNTCTKCKYIVSARIDPLHQCDDKSPFFTYKKLIQSNAWFKGTAIILYDEQFNVIKWTWVLNDPSYQIRKKSYISRWDVPIGVSNDYLPPWSKGIYDARLFAQNDYIYITYNCKSCDFSISQLNLDIKEKDGTVKEFRCWSLVRHKYSNIKSIKGRNQALFVSKNIMYLQPWIHKVATLGKIKHRTVKKDCTIRTKQNINICGIYPNGTKTVTKNVLKSGIYNHVFKNSSILDQLRKHYNFERRISTTCHLVNIKNGFLGIGHYHRKNGNNILRKRYAFGYEYEHFWYVLEDIYPYKMKHVSKSFCINYCDPIQFLSGLVVNNNKVVVSYGVNDCVSKIASFNIDDVYLSMNNI